LSLFFIDCLQLQMMIVCVGNLATTLAYSDHPAVTKPLEAPTFSKLFGRVPNRMPNVPSRNQLS
jgi:hypothetical protein